MSLASVREQERHGRDAVHALLADGTTVLVRAAGPRDLTAVQALFAALSPDSARMRFFASGSGPGVAAAQRLTRPDPDRIALLAIACRAAGEEVIGEAEAWRLPGSDTAEVGFTVAEGQRGRGVGTLLLEHLADAARARGIRRFVAETLADNVAMKRVIASAGLKHSAGYEHGGTVFHDIDLDEDDTYLDVVADREFHASAASLEALFRPRSVAVIGAGRRVGGVGRAILDHIVGSGFGSGFGSGSEPGSGPGPGSGSGSGSESGFGSGSGSSRAFAGRLYAVHPEADAIGGIPCARSIAALPQPVDLAIVALPADAVVDAAIACGRHGVRALVVVTSSVPVATSAVLKAVCRRYGMRLVGPNCLGVASFGDGIALDATFAPRAPHPGSVGIAVQSGGVGIAILEHLAALGLGAGSFVSLGDKADVSGNDLLAWWAADARTRMVLLHLESFGNPRKFARYARRVARTKPVLIVEAGRSEAGSRAAASHTAAAVTPTVTRRALFRQAGVIATASTGELVETAALLDAQPLPSGRRVAVISNAGGIGVLAADACVEAGLTVATFGVGLQRRLRALLGPGAAVANPVDAGAGAGAEALRRAVAAVCDSGEADAVLVLPVPTALADLRSTLAEGLSHAGTPIALVRVNQGLGSDYLTTGDGERIPVYAGAASAARALGHAADYAEWLRAPEGHTAALPGIRSEDASRIVSLWLDVHPDGGWLPPDRCADLLACYGIDCARLVLASNEHTAVTAAGVWDGPVVLKAYWPELVHKSDVDGVLLGLSGEADVRAGWRLLTRRFGDRLAGVVVQETAPKGVELLVGVDSDPVFGPLVGFGVGGTNTELIGGHRFALTPLTGLDADRLLAEPRAARLLGGFRGRPGADVEAVRDVLLRLARLATEQPCVAQAEINPLMATPEGAVAADFRIRIEARAGRDPYLRRLR